MSELHDALPLGSGDTKTLYQRRCSCGWQSGWEIYPDANDMLEIHLRSEPYPPRASQWARCPAL